MNKGLILFSLLICAPAPARTAVMVADDASMAFDLPRGWRLSEPEAENVVLDAARGKARLQIIRLGKPLPESALQNKNLKDVRSLGAKGALVPESIDRHELPSKDVLRSIAFELKNTPYRTGYFNFGAYSYSFFSQNMSEEALASFLTTLGPFPRPPQYRPRPRRRRKKNVPKPLKAAAESDGHTVCLDQITECFDETKDLSDCVDDADLCPKSCRDEFATMSQGETTASAAFQEIFMDPDSPCHLKETRTVSRSPKRRPAAPPRERKLPVIRPTETLSQEKPPPAAEPAAPPAATPAAPPPIVKPHDPDTTPAAQLKECGQQVVECVTSGKALDACVAQADKCPDICRQEYARLNREGVKGESAFKKIFQDQGAVCKPNPQ